MKKVLVALLCFFASTAFAQYERNYIPAAILDTIPLPVKERLKAKLEADKAKITEPKGPVNTYLRELYDDRTENVIQAFNSDYFIADSDITPYLQSVLEIIYKSNPQLPRETSVYAFRSEAVNAMSFGEGTIALTLGLLARMENEEQIAFVICHELAHYHAHHSDIKATQIARLRSDKDFKKKVREIARNEYGQYTRLTQLIGSLGVSITKHSREKEFESDSLALLYYLNTPYAIEAPVRTLEILDSADVLPYKQLVDLKKHFDFPNYPFKEKWGAYNKPSTWYAPTEALPDSMRTHPQCQKRIVALQRQLSTRSLTGRKTIATQQPRADDIRKRSEFEVIVSAIHFEQYGRALFLALLQSERFPENIYAQAATGQSLYWLYVAQKNHTLSSALPMPDQRYNENYDRVLTFAHTLRLSELGGLAYEYTFTRKASFGNDDEFLYTCWLISHTEMSGLDPASLRVEYLRKFPSGRHVKSINK